MAAPNPVESLAFVQALGESPALFAASVNAEILLASRTFQLKMALLLVAGMIACGRWLAYF